MTDPLRIAFDNVEQFTPAFIGFLADNAHVWEAFEREALAVIAVGFQHYSARTIVHVLRHHSALTEKNSPWKLNNDNSPYLARLWALAYPEHADFFEFRSTRTPQALP
jgi:hypothetical protein